MQNFFLCDGYVTGDRLAQLLRHFPYNHKNHTRSGSMVLRGIGAVSFYPIPAQLSTRCTVNKKSKQQR